MPAWLWFFFGAFCMSLVFKILDKAITRERKKHRQMMESLYPIKAELLRVTPLFCPGS
jgi:hypothetical protein